MNLPVLGLTPEKTLLLVRIEINATRDNSSRRLLAGDSGGVLCAFVIIENSAMPNRHVSTANKLAAPGATTEPGHQTNLREKEYCNKKRGMLPPGRLKRANAP